MSRSRPSPRRGFSLIELLLVLVILSMLSGLVIFNVAGRAEKAKKTGAKADISSIETELEVYNVDNGAYPTSDEGLQALITAPGSAKSWQGPYLKRGIPKDPWGNPYEYRCPGQHNTTGFDLFSHGPNGQDAGGDEINNWAQP